MSVNVLIPTPLRKFTENQDTVTVAPGTVGTVVAELTQRFPGIVKPVWTTRANCASSSTSISMAKTFAFPMGRKRPSRTATRSPSFPRLREGNASAYCRYNSGVSIDT